MPPATAAPPRAGSSPPDSAVAPHHLGFPPPLAGTPLSSSLGKPRHGSQPVPDTEDDPRTPGSAEFFLREPPESPDDNTALAHTAFTYEQQLQWKAQFYVYGDLKIEKPPAEHTMVHAFGGPVESQKHVWRVLWRVAVDRWESGKSLVPGYDTPPSSGSCTSEQGSKDTTVGKSTSSEQGGIGEEETQSLVVGSASIHPPKNTAKHTDMLEQKNDDEDHLAINCAKQVNQLLSDDGSNLKKNAVCGGQTFLESHFSSPKNIPGKNISDIQESCHSLNKSGPNSPRDIQESSSSRIGSCIAEQNTSVGKIFISEQHISDGGEEASQGPYFGSDMNHLAESTIDKVDQVISDDVNNLENNTVCGGKQSLIESCFKCGKHGQLLKCRSCPIAAHVSCFGPFGSSVRFNDGQFYCPACFFYKATEAHKKAVKELSEARKHLSAFLLIKPFAKQHCEQSTGNQQLSRKDEEPGCEKRNDGSDAFPERNYDPRTPARTRSPLTPRSPLAPRRRSFVTTARRKRIRWTGEEEAALREAVARFAPNAKGQISWVQIWEHGKDMFHPARLPKDLGRKWNYMKKRSEASEGCGAFKI